MIESVETAVEMRNDYEVKPGFRIRVSQAEF
jgi:hypothetical protein